MARLTLLGWTCIGPTGEGQDYDRPILLECIFALVRHK